jgi:ABC-type branched-subunit amino acid transport system ATPase component
MEEGSYRQINKEGVTVLLVEQSAAMVLAICHRGWSETGKIILNGKASELSGNDRVR